MYINAYFNKGGNFTERNFGKLRNTQTDLN